MNGGGGVLFNDAPSVETIRAIGQAHRKFGTTGFLPTLISADLDVVARAIAAVQGAIQAGVPGVLGIHIEGPFLNVARKGVHDPAKLRELDTSAVGLLTSLRGGKTLVTLAPEMTTPDIIQKLVKAGVVVSAGHTNATYAEIATALRHGLTGFTHLFNAMSQLTGREPGVVGAALDDRRQLVRHHCGRRAYGSGRVAHRPALQAAQSLHAGDRCDAECRHEQHSRSTCRAGRSRFPAMSVSMRTGGWPDPTSTWRVVFAMP